MDDKSIEGRWNATCKECGHVALVTLNNWSEAHAYRCLLCKKVTMLTFQRALDLKTPNDLESSPPTTFPKTATGPVAASPVRDTKTF